MHDLIVIGGGVMGRFTAYNAAQRGARVLVLERGRIGDPATASYGRTRSFRNDYLDPTYARLAHEAFRLWGDFERATGARVLVRCGCMNIAKRSITPDLESTYAELSLATLVRLGLETESLGGDDLRRRFPYLDADIGHLETDAGVVDLPAVTRELTRALDDRGVRTIEGVETTAIAPDGDGLCVTTDAGEFETRSLVVTAGHGTNDVLARVAGAACSCRSPGTGRARRSTWCRRTGTRDAFTADAMPVIAYLDAGIYCHPIVDGLVDAVKIGYYHPPDLPGEVAGVDGIASFVEQCMPGLRTRRCAKSTTSTAATTTSSPTTSSCSAPSPAWPTRTSASAGAAPASSSRPGSAACSRSARSRTARSTTSPASPPPASTKECTR